MDFSISKPPSGSVRILTPEDLNPQKPFIGWIPNSQGVGRHNPRGFAEVWVAVQKGGKDIYEQPMLVESAGSIVVCQLDQKVAMVQNFRMVAERLFNVGANYVRKLNDEHRWDELVAKLGEWRWELPRGIAPLEGEFDLNDFVIRTAKLELREEAGLYLKSARVVSRINTNPTFFAHSQFVVHGILSSSGQRNPEELEMIGDTRFFSAVEIREMVDRGVLDDGLTKAALADCAFHY